MPRKDAAGSSEQERPQQQQQQREQPQQLSPDHPEVIVLRAGVTDASRSPRERRFLALLAVHGDEPCGVVAANELLRAGFFSKAAASPGCPFDELRLVVGNPRALALGKRFLELNLNRAFLDDVIAAAASQQPRRRQPPDGEPPPTAADGGSTATDGGGGDGGGGGSDTGGHLAEAAAPAPAADVPYEAARAAELAPLIRAAGSLLDIHSTSCYTPPFAFYVPADRGCGAGSGGTPISGGGRGGGASDPPSGDANGHSPIPAEAELALSLPVAYAVRDYTGAGQGLAIEYSAAAAAAAPGALPSRASCVECGSHRDPAAAAIAEACLRTFATAPPGGGKDGAAASAGPRGVAAPKHVVARSGVIVRPGFRWLYGAESGGSRGSGGGGGGGGGSSGGTGQPPPAFARVDYSQVVAADDEAGDIACPCPGGALVFMPAGNPVVGEDAMLWAEAFE